MSILRALTLRAALSAALLAGGALAASGQSVLHRGNSGEPASLDPHQVGGTWENDIVGDLFMGLLTEAADGSAIPGAATGWTISDDGTVYTFTLREGAVWSDGVPVTAHDFVFAFNRILAPETGAEYAFLLYPIVGAEAMNAGETPAEGLGVEALDDLTLQITLNASTPYFLEQLTHYTAFPVPAHVVEAHGDAWARAGNMVTNGPYTLVEWLPNTHVHAIRSETFWDAENVAIDEVYYYPTEERSAGLRRFRAGELDLNTDFPTEQLALMRREIPDSVRIYPYLGIYYYPINTLDPVLSDRSVREALSLAINRRAITDQVLGTGEIPATSFAPPLAGYEPATAPYAGLSQADAVARARELMEEAGYGPSNRLSLVLRYNTSEDHRRVAVAVAAMWQEIYVDVELFNSDVAIHYESLRQGDFQVARAGWIADYPDAQNFLTLLESATGSYNYGRWSNEEFDALMREAAVTVDLEERARILQRAEQIALDDSATIPIYYYVSRNLVAPHVAGWVDNTKDIHRTRWLSLTR